MHLIKYTHACVRVEQDGRSLVIDPGVWSEAEALSGTDDVLITHEHFDHVDADRLAGALAANPALRVYAPASVAGQLTALGSAVTTVAVGDSFTVAGFAVSAVGGRHAEIYDGLPGCDNVGFIIDNALYHPGDSLFVPDKQVATVLVPASAPWLKLREAIDFVRAAKPARAFPIHDAMLSEIGQQSFDRWMDMKGDTDYARIPIGGSVELA